MRNKALKKINKIKNNIIEYFLLNKIVIIFISISMIGFFFARKMTLGNFFTTRSFLTDLCLILLFVCIGYCVKNKNKSKYYMLLLTVFTFVQIVNVIYYKFYTSFASISELSTLGQAETVVDSLFAKISILDISFVLGPFIFYWLIKKINQTNYNYVVEKNGFGDKIIRKNFIVAVVCMSMVLVTSTTTDFSRIANQWNRVSTAQSFSILFYQINDLCLNIPPKLFSFIGYDSAAETFHEYYDSKESAEENEYTGVLEGANIVFVHMESIQTFLMDVSFNGVDILSNTNQLAEEGMFFSNFYPQISTGTSSDSEFTLLTSLMPSSSGTVFVSYYNREYETVPKMLSEEGYYTFSMHGNDATMWNRFNVHPKLGYEDMYFEDMYDFTSSDILGLGINDLLFFEQSYDYLVDIENNNENYMGTVITLSNHSPFTGASSYINYDMSFTSNTGEVTYNFYDTAISDYFNSVYYADYALGEFMDMVRESDNFDNTLFVFYGDHDAKFSESEIEEYLSYNPETGEFDLEVEYDSFDHELNKSTPLIFWTKNEDWQEIITGEYDYPMGMIDVSPTILNMLGLENEYALGTDIFTIKYDNVVAFPNSNFLTNEIYYNSSTGEYKTLKENVIIDEGYIEKYLEIVETELEVSNAVIVYDLIAKEGNSEDEEDE